MDGIKDYDPIYIHIFKRWLHLMNYGITSTMDEDFWVELAPYIYLPSVVNKTDQEVEQIISLLKLTPSARVLDVGCGQGRHARNFAEKGFKVTALDINKTIIDQNVHSTEPKNLNIEWTCADMLDYCQPTAFDAILSLHYSFGFFKNSEDDNQVLHNFFKSLRPGGKIIFQLIGRELLEKWFLPKYWNREEDGSFLLIDKKINSETDLLEETIYLLQNGSQRKFQMQTKVYYSWQIKELLQKIGFQNIQIFGDFNSIPYNENATCLVLVAQKPINHERMIRC